MKHLSILGVCCLVFGVALFGWNQANVKAEKAAKPVQKKKEKKKKKLYKIDVKELTVKTGKSAKAAFHIKLEKGAKIHPQAPFRCAVSSTNGFAVSKKKLGHKDTLTTKDKRQVTVSVGAKGQKAGAHSVDFSCSFFLCTKDICARSEEKIKIPVKVK